jgi:hypothetical protein
MAKCLNCGKEYYKWDLDNGTPFELFCSDTCVKKYNEKLKEQDWPRDPALKFKVPVGEIACPNCGTVQHGVLNPICGFCDKPYWDKDSMKDENNPYYYNHD